MLQQSKTSFISIYAQFKSAIRPQFKLILIIHFSGLWQKEKNKKTKKLFRGQRSPGRLLKTKRKFIITFFLWHLALKFMILLMIRSSFLHKLRAFMWLHNFFRASGKKSSLTVFFAFAWNVYALHIACRLPQPFRIFTLRKCRLQKISGVKFKIKKKILRVKGFRRAVRVVH